MARLSVIIPTWNEVDRIASTVESLQSAGVEEIVVVDGDSSDGTPAAADRAGCRVERLAFRGRGRQLNAGARLASGSVFLFLHADTRPVDDSLDRLARVMTEREEVVGGGFVRRYDSPSSVLRATCLLAAWRSRTCGIFLGDQALFVRRGVFESLGGFEESGEPGEDLLFSARMRKMGPTVTIGPGMVSSARRFERRGAIRQTWSDLREARRILAQARGRARA